MDAVDLSPGPRARSTRYLRKPFAIIRADLGVYLVMNVLMYGLSIAGFVVGLTFPEMNAAQVTSLQDDGTAALVGSLVSNPWLFALVILGVNTVTVGALLILLPSMVVPFLGVALFGYKSFTLGVTLAPADENGWAILIPHSLTYLIEFQGYILLVFGAYLLGRSWLRPATIGAGSRRQGYVRGLRRVGWLGLLALALLIVGAFYEAFSIRYIVPLLLP